MDGLISQEKTEVQLVYSLNQVSILLFVKNITETELLCFGHVFEIIQF